MMKNWFSTNNNNQPISLDEIPTLSRLNFEQEATNLLCDSKENFPIAYFAYPTEQPNTLRLLLIATNQCSGEIFINSHTAQTNDTLPSLAIRVPSLTIFEREISELHGVTFKSNPWPKPVRYPFNQHNPQKNINNYPFYNIDSKQLHQVNVGPVHAGIIEPGVFRFLCEGETIFHLEIALGFQHRGIETLIRNAQSNLTRICLAEQIAGDTTIGHSTAMAKILEQGQPCGPIVDSQRIIALEMERIAMHIADTGALCGDIAYQLGQAACEALRTVVINTMQMWCGNRFGRTLIRPHGTNYNLSVDQIQLIKQNISNVQSRFATVAHNMFNTPTVLARLDEICPVDPTVALQHGAIGMAAKSCGIERDCRQTITPIDNFATITETTGDLLARIRLRTREVEQSSQIIENELKKLAAQWFDTPSAPSYATTMTPNTLTLSLVEGFRGMICHAAITSSEGAVTTYKIYDPSMRNWLMLAQSVRGAEISDFPLSNKSFNLSYCGNDL